MTFPFFKVCSPSSKLQQGAETVHDSQEKNLDMSVREEHREIETIRHIFVCCIEFLFNQLFPYATKLIYI